MNQPLKVIFWNIWGHRHPEKINAFLNLHRDADVICLTEVTRTRESYREDNNKCHGDRPDEPPSYVNGYQQLERLLSDTHFLRYDSATYADWTCTMSGRRFSRVGFGSVIATNLNAHGLERWAKTIDFTDQDDLKPRTLQWQIFKKGDTCYLVAHLHGVWIKSNTKGDHPARLLQSEKVRSIIKAECAAYAVDKVIFGGDLNLDANTLSLLQLQQGEGLETDERYNNLNTIFGITNTRTEQYRSYSTPGATLHADYVFTSQNVEVHEYNVHNEITASDHAPLVVTFS